MQRNHLTNNQRWILRDILSNMEIEASKIIRRLYYLKILWKILDKDFTLALDAGCGEGSWISREIKIKLKKRITVGLDIFMPRLRRSKDLGFYDDLICADVRYLPFREDTFDVVLALEVIEHLEKCEGYELLNMLKKLARKQVIFSTPVDMMPEGISENNIWEVHKSGWHPKELEKNGYKVRGVSGLFFFPHLESKSSFSKCLVILARFLTYFMQPLYYFMPEISFQMIGVKNLVADIEEKKKVDS